uniref:Uncharacterized protein n=1 Tax=Cafeteria roenbergensis TaxID=33653 RepID=A0A7S0PA38_CAFRO
MPATRVAPAVALLSLCAAGGLLSREVGPTGIVSAPPSAGTFHSPRAWGPTTADPDLLEFEVPELEFAIVSDLDHKSHYCGIFPTTRMAGDVTPSAPQSPPCDGVPLDQHWWIAFLRRGVLRVVQGATGTEGRARYPTYDVDFLETRVLQTQSATRGRSMELSELVRFRHLVLAVCDITGLVWKVQVSDGSVLQRHAIAGGNGDVSRPGKLEWATRKDGRLVMGSVGNRQMDTRTGAFLDRHSEWVKVLSQGGTIENSDWGPVFAALRTAAGVRGDGYLWHEAIEWDALSRRWIVLPRKRGFVTPFEPTRDESMGTNVLLVADEDFRHINVSSVGPLEPEWGFSSVRRVPGMRDVFAALKCREVDGEMQTRLTVFTLDGHFLLKNGPWLDLGNVKYEGLEFLGFHPLV